MKHKRIPEATIRRLSRYSICLEELEKRGEKIISSQQLAVRCLVKSPQVRRDLDYFGQFGVRGIGYDVTALHSDIKRILGTNRVWRLAVVGIGNLGSSLMVCQDLLKQNYEIVAAFDIHPRKVIGRVSEQLRRPVEIFHVSRIKEIARARKIEIGLITTPPSETQKVADMLVDAEVKGILNFAPAHIRVPEGYIVRDVFFTSVLDNLTYLLSNRDNRRRYLHESDEMRISRMFDRELVSAGGQLG